MKTEVSSAKFSPTSIILNESKLHKNLNSPANLSRTIQQFRSNYMVMNNAIPPLPEVIKFIKFIFLFLFNFFLCDGRSVIQLVPRGRSIRALRREPARKIGGQVMTLRAATMIKFWKKMAREWKRFHFHLTT